MRAAIRTEQSRFANIFFCSSGAEANEAAVKLAWKYGKHPCEVPMKFVVKSR
jgi:acetylornithine/succinyldiaminopimelate/putrescine aminotransferase